MLELGPLVFLRPWWLLAILPALVLMILNLRWSNPARRLSGQIDPHLLPVILEPPERRPLLRPITAWALLGVFTAIAVAGPAWDRQPSPFAEEAAPMVLAIDLSETMTAEDLAPSRFERAKLKAIDLIAARGPAPTALVAYAGSAHLVLPLTDDPTFLTRFVQSLDPGLMPTEGRDTAAAVALALEILDARDLPGTVLLFADGADPAAASAIERLLEVSSHQVSALLVAPLAGRPLSMPVDRRALEAAVAAGNGAITGLTVEDHDVVRLAMAANSHLQSHTYGDEAARWRDRGYGLVFVVALLSLLWCRRGWRVRWSVAALLGLGLVPGPADAQDGWYPSLWRTPDQAGQMLFDAGDYEGAAAAFEDPLWLAFAFYAGRRFDAAVQAFGAVSSDIAAFARANALAHGRRYEESIAAYDAILAVDPEVEAARHNRAVVLATIAAEAADEEAAQSGRSAPTELGADEIVIDEDSRPTNSGEDEAAEALPLGDLSSEQIGELWMRRLPTDPRPFLRLRFRAQLSAAEDP